MQNTLKNIVLGALFLVPFLAFYVADGSSFDWLNWGTSGLFFPFITGKNFVFRVLIEIALAAWVVLALLDSKYRPKKSPILLAYAVFMGVLFVANLLGVDPARSMWSNFERMEGFVGHIHIFAYLLVLSSMFSTLKDWLTMFRVAVWSNVLVLGWGILQLLGSPDLFFSKIAPSFSAALWSQFPIHMTTTRVDSTIGNSAYYAVYCLFFACIAALLYAHAKTKESKWFYGIIIALNLISLFYTGTRGTIIGLFASVVVSLGIIAWFEKGKARKTLVIALGAMAIVVASIFVFKNTEFIQKSPTLARIASISPTDITTMSRFTIWKVSYDAWKERPLLGYGQDNFTKIYAERFIGDKMWNLEAWYDRSHNVFFDWLVAGGILGLLSYLSIFGIAFYVMWRKDSHMSLREKALVTGALVGYFIHNVFVFDNLISYILFILILGYIIFATETRVYASNAKINEDSISFIWAPIVGILLVVTLYFVSYIPYKVNTLIIKGMDVNRLVATMPLADVLKVQKESFEKALSLGTLGKDEAREQYLQTTSKMVQYKLPAEATQAEQQAITQAMNNLLLSVRTEIETSYPKLQKDVRALSVFGSFYNSVNDGVSAEKVLSEAHTLSPEKQLITFDLIRAKLLLKKVDEAYILAQEAYVIQPLYPTAQKFLGMTAIYANKTQDARALFSKYNGTFPIDGDTIAAALETGNTKEALIMLADLKKARPELASQIDAYVKEILAGTYNK